MRFSVVALQTKFSLSSKFLWNLGSVAKTSTHALSTSSRKHATRFLVKCFGVCKAFHSIGSNHCILAQKFVSVSVELNHHRSPLVLDSDKGVCCRDSFFIVYVYWIDSYSRVDEGFTVGSCNINHSIFADDLVLLAVASFQQGLQHTPDQFFAACDRTGMKISIKNTGMGCLSRNPRQCMLQVSSITPQQVGKSKYLEVVFTSRVTEDGASRLIHGLVK